MFKKAGFIAAFALICLSLTLPSGDCGSLLFFKEGTQTTLTSYDVSDKVTGSSRTHYRKVTRTPGGAVVEAVQESFDKKGKSTGKSEFVLKCERGVLYFDLKMLLDEKQMKSLEQFEMKIEGSDKEIPSDLEVGTQLKDADVKFSFQTKEGMALPMMNMSVRVSNRKIIAIEKVSSPAGNWDCFKLTEDIEVKSVIQLKASSVTWFNYEAGIVKTESYNDKGKLTGKTLLTELVKKN